VHEAVGQLVAMDPELGRLDDPLDIRACRKEFGISGDRDTPSRRLQ